jgi:SAM-dependent methyltransferase
MDLFRKGNKQSSDKFSVKLQDSQRYWEKRYAEGRDSGAGSYGRLSRFKAEVLNDFVAKNRLSTVLELGCGDGNQLKLAKYPRYIGMDVSKTAIQMCVDIFGADESKSFIYYDPEAFVDTAGFLKSDLTLSLDVIYHLIEDEVFESHMRLLFALSGKYVAVYASNHNDNSDTAKHVKHRHFTEWIDENMSNWELVKKIENKYPFDPKNPKETSFADLYIYKNIE